jgi:uncharacterized protein involved in exopolysaccharide biosynthesis
MSYGSGPEERNGAAAPSNEGLSLLDVMSAVLRGRRLVVTAGLVCAVALGIFLLVRPRTYTSTASFTPQASRSELAGLGGLAAQFGVAVPAGESNQSPAFYADLLKSRTILEPLVDTVERVHQGGAAVTGTFASLSRITARDSAERVEKAIKALRKAMDVTVVEKTGMVKVSLRTRYAELSHNILAGALEKVDDFNQRVRRSQAAAQREFLDRRIAAVSAELHGAEDSLRAFAEANRGSLLTAPQLLVRQQRLNRSVSLHEQVYASLAQALEQAKLDEIRDAPLITVVEQPSLAPVPDPRGTIIKTLLAFLVGCFAGAVLAIIRQAIASNRQTSPESFLSFSDELAATRSDFRRLVRPLSRERPSHTHMVD